MRTVGRDKSSLKYASGLTLIELLVTIAVVGVLIALAAPNMSSYWRESRLVSATEAIYSHMQLARSVALARNDEIFVDFVEGASWCMAISEDSSCDCSSGSNCTLTGMPQSTLSAVNFPAVSITTSFTGESTSIEVPRGTVSDTGVVTLTSSDTADQVQVSISALGRLEICSDNLGQYPEC